MSAVNYPCPTCHLDFYAEPACVCGVDWDRQREVNERGAAAARAYIRTSEESA